ncbi:MAG TPA: DUF5686 family protein [Flavisolibacter sp.]|nr:DUF5686 family protein [Flavisolibacter sp.]
MKPEQIFVNQRPGFLLTIFTLFIAGIAFGQTKIIVGYARDEHSLDPVPFASARFRVSGNGALADSSGRFWLYLPNANDTLEVTSVGYQDFILPIHPSSVSGDTLHINTNMVPGKITTGVVIKAKVNRALILWKRIVAHKPQNDRYRFNNFSYEIYNKLELDLKNINKEKLSQAKLIKPFSFILDNIDTADGASFLPAYLTEAISNYYYQKNPVKRREVFTAVKTIGVQNESISKLLGGMDQNINFYNNFIPVFDKLFVSPISDNGDNYYNYKIADTQKLAGKRIIHLLFSPKRKGENTFEGDCWVHDTTYAIQKMNLRLDASANVNYVQRLSLIQEYQLINDSTWFLSKDKFVVDVNPVGKHNIAFIGRKTTTYQNVLVNDSSVTNELAKNKKKEEVILPSGASNHNEDYWANARPEELSETEKTIYKTIDTLLSLPAFQRYTRVINFIGTGYLPVGKFLLGPWQNWFYTNSVEGARARFDLGTNSKWQKYTILHGYAAYGFGDRKWKGEVDAMYLFRKHPRMYVYGEYVNDFDYGQQYFGEISADNIFSLAIRKSGVPVKYIRLRQEKFEFFKEWGTGLSVLSSTQRKQYNPVKNLPSKLLFPIDGGEVFNTFETSVRLRFAYLEKFLENTFYRTSLGSPYPIVELKYTKGISGVLRSGYDYSKLSGNVHNFKKIPPLGSIYYKVFGGKTFGTLPYPFLDVAPGNEIYYYDQYAFNLMNKWEFIHDQYAGVQFEHNFGNGLFRFIPLTRKLKFRQFWTAKALWGSLSDKNYQLNSASGLNFQSLNGKTYLEVGTGIDNIFKVLRFDFIYRPLPLAHSNVNHQRFGVFGSFRFTF